jgi:hypothetical protein
VFSQAFSQNLIELQTDMVSAAISDAALRLERASRAGNLVELFRTRSSSFRRPARGSAPTRSAPRRFSARPAREVRAVAAQTYEKIVDAAPAKRKPRKTAARKTAKVRKSTRRARKAA